MARQNVNLIPRHNRWLTRMEKKGWEKKEWAQPNIGMALEILKDWKHERKKRRRGKAKSQW